jgi:hypothetical protein
MTYKGLCPICGRQLIILKKFLECVTGDYRVERKVFEKLWGDFSGKILEGGAEPDPKVLLADLLKANWKPRVLLADLLKANWKPRN